MKHLASLALALGLALGTMLVFSRDASATPFADVPANHWAYQYIQSLAADGIIEGYPDGEFKGDRPLTRYEMAVVVARVIAKLQENEQPSVSKSDLDKLQKLIDALKDELDALGVRVTNLEDAVDALDKRTKFAQSLSMHGTFLPNVTLRERPGIPQSVRNGDDTNVTTYYGNTVTPGTTTSIDPFVNAFMTSDDTNSPFTQAGSGVFIRQDSRFSLDYAVTPNLTVSLPVHILNYEVGGDFTQDSHFDIEPSIDIGLNQVGAISNLHLKFGEINDMASSRTGLTFRAPFGTDYGAPYEIPYQPWQKGIEVSGTVAEGAFGSTDFRASFTRVDNTLLNTQTNVTDPTVAAFGADTYLYPVVPPPAGFTQTGQSQAYRTDTFNAGAGTLAQVFLSQKAVDGSVYVSYYDGTTYNQAGGVVGGPANPLPGFTYNDAYNAVVFTIPLPAGSVVSITYRGLTATNNTSYQRYMTNVRLNQKFKGALDGLEIGATINRIYDFVDTSTTGTLTQVFQSSPTGYGLVSDTVFGMDFQYKLPFAIDGAGSNPVLYGEAASSKYSPDYMNVAAVGDTAGVGGVKFALDKVQVNLQYQSVGTDFFDGAPFRYYGNAPPLFANYTGPFFPDFFGFGNNLGLNQQFDNSFARVGSALEVGGPTTQNPNLTYIYPIFNPFRASGPEFYSAFAPNTVGPTLALNTPITIGDVTFTTRAQYSHLEELRADPYGALTYGPEYTTSKRMTYDTFTLGTQFYLPLFHRKLNGSLAGTYEMLRRNDMTAYQYYPYNPATETSDPTAVAEAAAAFGAAGSPVAFYPNYVNVRHVVVSAAASLPLTRDLALGGTYSTQHYSGSNGTTLQNIAERKDYYTGSLTYSIPRTNSSISFIARNYRYLDYQLPSFNYYENRQDVNFTVRF